MDRKWNGYYLSKILGVSKWNEYFERHMDFRKQY